MNLKTLLLLTSWVWFFLNTLIVFMGEVIGVGYEGVVNIVIFDSIIFVGFAVSIAIMTWGDEQ